MKALLFLKSLKKITEDGYRPPIKEDVPKIYKFLKELIENCLSQDPEQHPSFHQIVEDLKTKEEFLENVDEEEFFDYVDYIDDYKAEFDMSKRVLHFEDFIKVRGRKKNVRKVTLSQFEDIDEDLSNNMEENSMSSSNDNQRIENDQNQMKSREDDELQMKNKKDDEKQLKNNINENQVKIKEEGESKGKIKEEDESKDKIKEEDENKGKINEDNED